MSKYEFWIAKLQIRLMTGRMAEWAIVCGVIMVLASFILIMSIVSPAGPSEEIPKCAIGCWGKP